MTDTASVWERVRGMVPVSMCDWPGRVSCVLFTSGCNLRCPTCHNGDLAWRWQHLPALDRETVLPDLVRRRRWLDGITLSGGEPTILPDLFALLADLATTGLPVKLDSNGSAPDILARALAENLVHSVAVDVKGPWDRYPDLTGRSMTAEAARGSLEQVFRLARTYPGRLYFRCTRVPMLSAQDLETTRTQVPPDLPLIWQDYVAPKHDEQK